MDKDRKVDSPFTARELAHFKRLLLDRRARILSTVTDMEEEALRAGDQDFSVDHMADHGSDNWDKDLALSLVAEERKELYEIDRALDRIAQRTYGVCEGTGGLIGRARLEAIPWARHSIEYQRKVEAGEVSDSEEE